MGREHACGTGVELELDEGTTQQEARLSAARNDRVVTASVDSAQGCVKPRHRKARAGIDRNM